ncbi:MAG: fibrobacter succinogenes major paralogous domain-containing protein [Bacteroidales bacterium]|jgi:uncharacterized protein (TIGR02145 family)|nr:fibrobacter succinogenes major paralogous domain-containing protein [Bacteroidales bacterium]
MKNRFFVYFSVITMFLLCFFFFNSCKKEKNPPTVTTTAITGITLTSAESGGSISDDGGSPVTARGICWNTDSTRLPTLEHNKTSDGSGTGSFRSIMLNLKENTTYYVRAYAINSAGRGYGNVISFTTLKLPPTGSIPVVITHEVTQITDKTAHCRGTVENDGDNAVTARGICWATTENPTVENNKTSNGEGTGSFANEMTGLTPNTTYYVRAYATNEIGVGYGAQKTFKTLEDGAIITVSDIDGNTYNTVIIGTQTWMAQNLRTTKLNDGTPIEISEESWGIEITPELGWYDSNDVNSQVTYGALYNGYTIETEKLCPEGWHVPTNSEWETLIEYLGGYELAGGKLKNASNLYWNTPNEGATNEYGFNALAGGYITGDGYIEGKGVNGSWWTSSNNEDEYYLENLLYKFLQNTTKVVNASHTEKNWGLSVRCIKNQ